MKGFLMHYIGEKKYVDVKENLRNWDRPWPISFFAIFVYLEQLYNGLIWLNFHGRYTHNER